MSNFMKIRSLRAELFYVDGRKDISKLLVAFRNFANALKNDLNIGVTWLIKRGGGDSRP